MKFVNFSNKKTLNNRHSSGFALPTILIVSIIMLMVLVAAVSSAASVRMAMVSQYYNQLSQTAADAGTAYANACLDANNGVPQWSDSSPLKPNTDCFGAQLAGFSCPVASVEPRCYVLINSGVISSFSVGKPEVDSNGKVVNLNVKGFVNLTRTSDGSVWRSYSQSNNTKNSYPGIVTNGLVMNLDAGDPLSYSGNGTGWTDLSGNNNNGVLMNGVGYSSANGGALSFDGLDDYVDCGNLGSFPSNGSISFWMNPSVVENYRDPFTTNYNAGYTTNIGIRFEEHVGGYFEVDYGNDAGAYAGTAYSFSSLTANSWYHISVVWDVANNNIQGYFNGVKLFDKTQTLWPTKMPAIAIGAGFNTTRYWKGLVSGVQIYNRALSAAEIQQNFNVLGGRYGFSKTVRALVVAGGGGGGMDMGGGGGGGGVIYAPSLIIANQSYSVVVGNGGSGAPAGSTNGQPGVHQFTISASSGQNSSFGSLSAVGGGYGGSSYYAYTPNFGVGGTGGSGGGSSGYSDTTIKAGALGVIGQGNNGGQGGGQYYSGGGGGAGSTGSNSPNQPNGGAGLASDINGTNYYWGGGGGGAGYSVCGGNGGVGGGGGGAVCATNGGGSALNSGSAGGGGVINSWANMPGGDAGANTGGGGGGGSHYNANNKGGDGGSGIVIISYPTGSINAIGGIMTSAGGNTIHTFKINGNFIVGASQRTSCSAILSAGESTGDGPYLIYPTGSTGIQVYCDMTTDGGGWTLVLQNNSTVTTPSPTWNDAISGNTIMGTFGSNLTTFDNLVGLGFWNGIGTQVRLQVGTAPTALSHKATYNISLNAGNYYALNLSNENILLGGTVPGFYANHNGKPFTTYDADHDTYATNCSASYNNHPWWYTACWGGNFFAGGGYQEAPYWSGSTTDYYAYGSIWLK